MALRICSPGETWSETLHDLAGVTVDEVGAGDLDGDGVRDLVLAGPTGVGWMRGLAGDGARPFEAFASLDTVPSGGLAVGPVGASGDAIVVAEGRDGWTVLSVSPPARAHHAPVGTASLSRPRIAELDAIPGADIAFLSRDDVSDVSVTVVSSSGPEDWFAIPTARGRAPTALFVLDWDLDGDLDLLAATKPPFEESVAQPHRGCLILGPVSPTSACTVETGFAPPALEASRVTPDGLVIVQRVDQQVALSLVSARGTALRPGVLPAYGWTSADLGGVRIPGVVDLIVAARGGGFSVFAGSGPAAFAGAPTASGVTRMQLDELEILEANGDGIDEVLGISHLEGGDVLTLARGCVGP